MTHTPLTEIESLAALTASPQSTDFQCELAAWSVLKLGLPELAELRKRQNEVLFLLRHRRRCRGNGGSKGGSRQKSGKAAG